MAVYTLNGVEFEVERSDIWVSSPPLPPQLRHEHTFPYSGGEVVVDHGGAGLAHWTFTMLVTAANRVAMEANLGIAPVSLVTPDGTFANCELAALDDRRTTLDRARWAYSADISVAS